MTETNKMLEECANYLLNHCFVLGGVEDQRAKYLYVQDHLNEVRAVFAPLGYSVVLYPPRCRRRPSSTSMRAVRPGF